MKFLKFEYKITIFYLLAGGLWILFSDKILLILINDRTVLSEFQTYKGWFYVVVTAIILYFFIRKHLNKRRDLERKLQEHQNHLEKIVKIRTVELESTIKHLKETQSHLVQSEKMASLGLLTAGVAHEINNPLNYIMGSYSGLKLVLKKQLDEDEKLNKLLKNLKIGVDKAAGIVKGLNQFSRDQESFDETCEIHSILDNCLVMLNSQLNGLIKIERDYAEALPPCIGNVGKLHQVFINILTNSIQAINTAGKIKISTKTINNSILIEIADTGCGISKEDLPKIFDPFFTTKDPGKGTGLGLAITYNIIKMHNGQLDFTSELTSGTNAKIILPIK